MDPEKDLINFFETQQGGVIGKMSISQHAFSGDGISFIAKDVQHWLETNRVDRPFVPGEDKYPLIVTKVDIKNFFPEVDRRPIEDMLAGIASQDYPFADIKMGDQMPSHQDLAITLLFFKAVYGHQNKLTSHHPGRLGVQILNGRGTSQGCALGGFYAVVGLQFVLNTLAKNSRTST